MVLLRWIPRLMSLPAYLASIAIAVLMGVAPVWSQDAMLQSGEDFIARIASDIQNLNTEELLALSSRFPNLELIDVRTAHEIALTGGMIDLGRRTHHIERGWLEFRVSDRIPDLDTQIVLYCGTNRRSPLAAATLQRMGYTHVYNYADGFPAWLAGGHAVQQSDEYVGSMLFRKPMEVAPGVWSAIGATAPPTYENSGHNNNLSFVIGSEAVMVVNASDNYLLAESLHNEIKKVTELPVKYVVLENGQGHAMLGMSYWQGQGASIIAHIDTADVIESHGDQILERMQLRNRDKAMGTVLSAPDLTFESMHALDLGDLKVEIHYLGPSHSPGDTQVWLPDLRLMIAGDLAFHERLLPVFDDSDTAGWIETWEAFESLAPQVVIPGHGHPTTIDVVKKWTIGYLEYMRGEIAQILNTGGSLVDAYKIDQSAYSHLDTFDELAGLNADRIYRAMEFE
jgi:glyoxylase-like metal-dependent hydrolase (beta-lactamase superfamily II)/rhodanese-related sulfurtransferase